MIKNITFSLIGTLLILTLSFWYLKTLFSPVSSDNKSVDFLIPKGSSVAQIGNKLKSSDLIRSGVVFKFYVQISNNTNKIQAGEFQLSPNLSLIQIVDQLKKGPKEIWVTIPEGLRREEVALKFAKTLEKDNEFVKEFLNLTAGKEGYLFPDTYLFPKSVTATQIVNKLTSTFEKKINDITFEQVTIASLLERETFEDSEKPIVAGIIYKRLKNDWPLQIDATLQYAKGNWEPVFSIDKEIKSPFNTYKNLGLPPSPIASAGLSSLMAAINPESSDYWYYIHDKFNCNHNFCCVGNSYIQVLLC